jgi:PilZ domain-containing protein
VIEKRRHPRTPVDLRLEMSVRGSPERVAGRAKDLSLGGMLLDVASPPPFGAEVVLHVPFGPSGATVALAGVVRWVGPGCAGVQFGLLGARETHAITELSRVSD